jgi:chorismate mutase
MILINISSKKKQECTSLSPSGRHMGHYKTILECIRRDNTLIPEMIISIAYIDLSSATTQMAALFPSYAQKGQRQIDQKFMHYSTL